MRVRNEIIVSLFLVFLIISAGCTVYEKEEVSLKEPDLYDDIAQRLVQPVQDVVDRFIPQTGVSTSLPPSSVPVSVNPVTGYSMENFTPDITAVPQPNPPLIRYYPVYSQQYRLLYNLEGPYGLEMVCNEAPIRIELESNPDHTNPRLSYALWELMDMETGEVIEEGGYGREYIATGKQTLDIRRPGSFHLNLYGARINVKVTVLSPHAADMVLQQPQITSPYEDEEEYYW
ncbi:hypothetical protein [Methanocalculus sp. MC3]